MSNDWIEHNGGPRPVDDEAWVEVLFPGAAHGWMTRAGNRMALTWKGQWFKWRFINQHLIDAARLEGIRLGLEAAARALDGPTLRLVCDAIRNLNPDTIAREAVLDQLTSEAQAQDMGYDND